jgi:anti-anti-sigma regulatory factor
MLSHQGKLVYFLSEKNDFLVVSFVGFMNKTTAKAIEVCHEEVLKARARFVVLSFHDIQQLEPGAVPALVRLQRMIREKPGGEVRICFLHPSFQKFLQDSGAIRPNELSNNLLAALQSLAPVAAKKAA